MFGEKEQRVYGEYRLPSGEVIKTHYWKIQANSPELFMNGGELLYVMKNPLTDLTKIGITHDLHQRKMQLQNSAGCYLDVILTAGAYWCDQPRVRVIESFLHGFYHRRRVLGEWFRLTNRNICFISAFCDKMRLEVRQ